ncbi:MAG: phage integrase SAM-like domain-containing protein [Methylococcales bacterium]|nr:phage integrase SAM-like domain-containing protein [Methylococcales bacterium]
MRKSSRTKVKQEAQQLHDKLKAESWRVGTLGAKPVYTWQQAVLKYLLERENQKSIRTTKQVLRYLDLHLGNKNLNEINKSVIEQIRQHKKSTGVTVGTVNKTLTILRAVLNAAKEWEWLDNSPAIKLMPDNAIRVRWLTQDQVKTLLNELPEHLEVMVRFSLATGLRESNVRLPI